MTPWIYENLVAISSDMILSPPGDVGPIGEGLSELRIDFGPGYRVYYARAGKTLYLVLCGGDKGSQDADIKNAHAMWRELNPPAKKPAKKE